MVKTPRFQFIDSGLPAALTGATPESLARERGPFGRLLESFVFGELLKLVSWSEAAWRMSHYRDHDGYEVDFVVENAAGGLVGIEVKAGATARRRPARGEETQATGRRAFHRWRRALRWGTDTADRRAAVAGAGIFTVGMRPIADGANYCMVPVHVFRIVVGAQRPYFRTAVSRNKETKSYSK